MTESTTIADVLNDTRELLAPDLAAMDTYLRAEMSSDIPLINTLGEHILQAGGKRIRPMLVLLVARAFAHDAPNSIILAVIIEFIHTATLLHDDIVDEASLRRGHHTANHLWGNGAAVLVGDFLYSRSFQMMVQIGRLDIMAVLADITNRLAEGEVLQLAKCGDLMLCEKGYNDIIERKTACLFAAAMSLPARLANQPAHMIETLYQCGLHFGYAYQLIDDRLDYEGDSHNTGKRIGKDLSEGKMTLPLIHALTHTEDKASLLRAIKKRKIKPILRAIDDTHASEYTLHKARTHAASCQSLLASSLPDSPYLACLQRLIEFIVTRTS